MASDPRSRLAIRPLLAAFALVLLSATSALAQRNRSEEPPIRDYTTKHFVVHTDLSQEEAKELMLRLETMLGYVAGYWGRPPSGVIECYVVKDLAKWPEGSLAPEGRVKVAEGAGITISQSVRIDNKFKAKAVVYAIADRGTPQHEAVHAYCSQTFGTTGPVWYAEGMAEIGQYWREGEVAVNAHPEVIRYLSNSEPKKLTDIVSPLQFTGDSWQNYAWRWALCYLLANNPNYADRFRPLGLGLLAEQPVSFELTYGAMAQEITFEYEFFIKHLAAGYRADLTSWNWSTEFRPLQKTGRPISSRIMAAGGWQPSSLEVTAGNEYAYDCSGSWKTSKGGPALTADGDEKEGLGRLVAVVMKDFQLSEPFALGAEGKFIAPSDGRLYFRCNDRWNELADNTGRMTVKLTATGETGSPTATQPVAELAPGSSSAPVKLGPRRPGRLLKIN
ncbi:MAG: hypothetical protein RIC55_32040 [Pirellulaceae bacterium]